MNRLTNRSWRQFLTAGLAGLGIGLAAFAAPPAVKVVVQLPYTHQFQFAGLYAAQAKGFFAGQGLEVELRTTSSERSRPLNEVLTGQAEFGILQGPQLVASRLEGSDVVVIAAIMQHSPQVLVTRAEDNIRTPHDLIGKRVALDQTSLVSEVRLMLEREGVSMDKIVVVPNRWDVDELQTRTADAMSTFVIDGPYELEQAGIKVNIIRPVDYGVDFYGDCLYSTSAIVRGKPELVEAMRTAVAQGWDYALRHSDEMIDWILAHYRESQPSLNREGMRNEARQVARLINADLVGLGHMNEGRWRVMGDIMHAQNGGTNLERLDGFVYAPPSSESNQYQWLIRWVGWGLAVAVVIAALTLLANRRLQRLVEHRTRELQLSERRQREVFDLAPAAIARNDYTSILPHLQRLREAGVTDLNEYLTGHPGLVKEWCALVRVIDANLLALQFSGVATVAELDARRMAMFSPETIDAFRDELLAIWQGRDQLRLEKSYLGGKGRQRKFLVNWSAPHLDGRPDYTRVQLVYADVTEIRETEQALRLSEERYRLLFEQSPLAIVEFDYSRLEPWFAELRAQGVTDLAAHFANHPAARAEALARTPLVDANQTTLNLLGVTTKQELAARLPTVFTERTIAARCQNVVRIWQGILWAHGELEVRRFDGQLRTMEYHWRMPGEGGKPAFGRTQTVLVDITEKLVAERLLRESEARYRGLFENAVDGIYRSTSDGRFIAVNPALVRMLGFDSAQELLAFDQSRNGQPFYVQPRRRDEFLARLAKDDYVTNFESEIRRKDGTTIWLSENVRVVRDPSGDELYHEGFVSDITLHRRLEAEMLRASKLEAVGILAGGIAHDFNNILTVVLGNITLAEMDAGPGVPYARLLGEAKRATLRARDLTQQLLTFAKGGEPVRATIELPELLTESAEFALHGAKVRVEYQIAPDLWPANADKGQLGQVVQNLAINSVQAMPDGGTLKIGAVNVTLDNVENSPQLPPGRYVRLTIADTGTGIAAEHLAKIFDPYFTTKQQGSGLGLATVYSIVKKHQGHIEVESTLGHGTAFHIWLPAAISTRTGKRVETTTATPLRARVLFMDDEASIRAMTQLFLNRLQVDCELAVDGEEAVRKFQQARSAGRPFDLVLMDLTVPGGMGGREALDRLKEIDPQVRAIVSSGYSRDPVMSHHQAHGFLGVLPKPYDLVQLRKVLDETLRGSNKPRPA